MNQLSIMNFGFVLFFGIVLSLSFSDIDIKSNKRQYALIFCVFGIVQIITFLAFGEEILFKSYPILTHLPLFLLLKVYYKRNRYIAGISVLSAYLFCTPRKWIGTMVSFFWDYDADISYIVQIAVTIPLLLVILKYISPYVARLKFESEKILKFFILVPLTYYVLEYILTVYSDLLYRGGAAIVEFMDASVVVVYFIFSIYYLKTLYEKKEVEVEQALFKVMADQSKSEIEMLRESEKQVSIYRHDLRHHMNYLSACISQKNTEEALSYMENAINASEKISDSYSRCIKLRLFSKNNKLCVDIRNRYQEEPVMHQGFPVSQEQGHGFGTKSMAHVVENYAGICQFSVKEGWFIFQATM